jgi:hypothetical protein
MFTAYGVIPLHMQAAYAAMGLSPDDLPVARDFQSGTQPANGTTLGRRVCQNRHADHSQRGRKCLITPLIDRFDGAKLLLKWIFVLSLRIIAVGSESHPISPARCAFWACEFTR